MPCADAARDRRPRREFEPNRKPVSGASRAVLRYNAVLRQLVETGAVPAASSMTERRNYRLRTTRGGREAAVVLLKGKESEPGNGDASMLVRLAPFVRARSGVLVKEHIHKGAHISSKRHHSARTFLGSDQLGQLISSTWLRMLPEAVGRRRATKAAGPNNGAETLADLAAQLRSPSCHEKTGIESPLVSRNWQVGSTRVKFGITSCRSGTFLPRSDEVGARLELRSSGTGMSLRNDALPLDPHKPSSPSLVHNQAVEWKSSPVLARKHLSPMAERRARSIIRSSPDLPGFDVVFDGHEELMNLMRRILSTSFALLAHQQSNLDVVEQS